MNKTHLLKLLKQFHEADGITSLMKIDDNFISWLKEYQSHLLQLKDYYDSLGLSIDEWDSYELGKGLLDSIILDKNKCISMYAPVKSELFVLDDLPLHISEAGIKIIEGSDLFYTYNPYTIQEIELIKRLSLLGNFISISATGKTFDKNKQSKIKQLDEQFSDFEIKHNYEESGDNYFYTLYTPRHIKTKTLIR